MLKITLKYSENQENKNNKIPAISGLRRVSKPGQRIYVSAKEIKPVKNGYGIAIISTSKGLTTDKSAKKQKIGGEIICEVW
jgi:small subunit ribosomal protein S8